MLDTLKILSFIWFVFSIEFSIGIILEGLNKGISRGALMWLLNFVFTGTLSTLTLAVLKFF